MSKRERSKQRSASSLPLAGRGRGGGAGANLSKVAPPPPSPALPHRKSGVPDQRNDERISDKPEIHEGESSVASARPGLVLLGEFGRAHGLKGEVRLKSYTADPQAIADYGPLLADGGRSIVLKSVRPAPGSAPDLLIAQVQGITSREAAEALNRIQLFLEREKLPPPEEEDEFLLADLIGLPVQNEAGTVLGTIVDVPNYGGGDLFEIAPVEKGPTAFLPFTKAFVPVVEVAQKRVVIAPPEDFFAPARPEPDHPEDEA